MKVVKNAGRTIFFGVLLGAVAGLVAALLLNRRAEKENRSTAITAGEGRTNQDAHQQVPDERGQAELAEHHHHQHRGREQDQDE